MTGATIGTADDSHIELIQHRGEERRVQQDPYVGKQTNNRIVTIFTTWNAMVGLGLVTIPWAYGESGLILGIMITVF
jgi:hypothetical protein